MRKYALVVIPIALAVFILIISNLPKEEICDFKDNDKDGLVDEGFSITCWEDKQCGPSGFFGEKYCRENQVVQKYYENKCIIQPGTCKSKCSGQEVVKVIEECDKGCDNGKCIK